jgi:hypothetical protein
VLRAKARTGRFRRDTARDSQRKRGGYVLSNVRSVVAWRRRSSAIDEEDKAISLKQSISEGGIVDELCSPDVVSPQQFQEMWKGIPERSAEFKLAIAVLEQTVEDLRRYRSARSAEPQRLYMQAHRWVSSNDRRWPYSFLNVCDMLNVSSEPVRTKILEFGSAPWKDVPSTESTLEDLADMSIRGTA